MPGHVQINSFAIYNPLLFVFVHFVDVGCRNHCAENEHKGLHQEMKNYFSILYTFFLSSSGFFLAMTLYGLAFSLFPFLIFFFSAFLSHPHQFCSGP